MTESIDHDQIFKQLIETFFKEFVELFIPEHAPLIDFEQPISVNTEIFTDLYRGEQRDLDLVVEVSLRDGTEETVLVHVEFQSTKQSDFAARMFNYYCQLHLRYQRPIVPVAIFSDDAQWTEPVADHHAISVGERTYVDFFYHLIKLKALDYRTYLRSENPLAVALMAKMNYDRHEAARLKAGFLRLLLGFKLDRAKQWLLVEFVETYMRLNSSEQETFESLVRTDADYQEVETMLTVYEERGIEKGIEKGIERGLQAQRDILLEIVRKRFGQASAEFAEQVNGVGDIEKLKQLILQALDAEHVGELDI